ncbi:hypothetical protein A5707_11365 [Mycobacterium kyorinense]|uniref:Uncharacterized protein n=1 Tax=Mycobacterium kyorinense TaxID=487514 RepID=A0A1A2ZSA3_9MYCO|nr:hypothetical protein [Mycobacterium kyorinense]OBI53464.1 hypothetical protein A5707_11365 [Mycobacterium kyorinense]
MSQRTAAYARTASGGIQIRLPKIQLYLNPDEIQRLVDFLDSDADFTANHPGAARLRAEARSKP